MTTPVTIQEAMLFSDAPNKCAEQSCGKRSPIYKYMEIDDKILLTFMAVPLRQNAERPREGPF